MADEPPAGGYADVSAAAFLGTFDYLRLPRALTASDDEIRAAVSGGRFEAEPSRRDLEHGGGADGRLDGAVALVVELMA